MPPPKAFAFAGDSQMAAQLRSHDWRCCPIGLPETWPPSLQSAVDLILHSALPMFVAWGPQRIFLYNDACSAILGARHPAAFGLPLATAWPEVGQAVADYALLVGYHELCLMRHGVPERVPFTFTYAPLHDKAGDVVGLFCTVMDTTARMPGDARERCDDILDTISEGFALFDRYWITTRMNVEGMRICAATRDDIIGRSHWDAFPGMRDGEAGRMVCSVMATRKAGCAEHCHVFADGRRLWTDIRAYPTQDGGIATFFRDITDRKLAEEKLVEADRRKDEFLAMLAHELRNPLAPISAAAELLRIGNVDARRVQQSSTIISRQVRHMTRLVDDLLDVSRVTRGLITLGQARVAARTVVEEAIEQVRPTIDTRAQTLTVRLPPDGACVRGDKARLVQVVANVLANAAKYTPAGRGIDLRADLHGTRLVLSVRDEGIGMDIELTGRVFDLFTQAERSSDRAQGGLGLGLALVKHLVELHGGTVGCSSPGLGKGSTFVITLPLLLEDAPCAPAPVAAATPDAARLKVLVVDDNTDAAETLGLLLAAQGHDVAIEHGALRALARARSMRPDVCLLDIGLPEIDGNELARRLREDPGMAAMVLIAVTGYGQPQDRDAALASGFAHHLVKPLDFDVLLRVLAGVRARAAAPVM